MPRLIKQRTLACDDYLLLREAQSLADVPDGLRAICPWEGFTDAYAYHYRSPPAA